MKKLIINFDETTNTFYDDNNVIMFTYINPVLKKYEEKSSILELVKQGLTADDLINLKKQDLI